jgi:hypothetical protein
VANGAFTADANTPEQAGTIKATAGTISGEARARVAHPLPWTETFESYAEGAAPPGWINAGAEKLTVATLDGQKVLQKPPDTTIFKRGRVFIGPVDWSNYTIRPTSAARQTPPDDGYRRDARRSPFCTATRSG